MSEFENQLAAAAVDEAIESVSQARQRQVDEYLLQALARPDPLDANLGALNADLMALTHIVSDLIQDALRGSEAPLLELEELAPNLDFYLRLLRQVDRFTQLEDKRRPGVAPAEEAVPRRRIPR